MTAQTIAPVLTLITVALPGLGGCVSGSLASSTGPRPPGHRWSVAGRQEVHVGELVEFDFVLQDAFRKLVPPLGIADYCLARIGSDRVEAVPDGTGHFSFVYRFDRMEPGERIEVRAVAYRQRGERDFIRVRGQWLQADSPYAQADQEIATDSIELSAYATAIELRMPRPPDDLDPETGVCRLRRLDGTTTPIYIERPGRRGFAMTGPEPDGYYRISYRPRADELNPTGTTEAVFTVYDVAGHRHTVSTELDTP